MVVIIKYFSIVICIVSVNQDRFLVGRVVLLALLLIAVLVFQGLVE